MKKIISIALALIMALSCLMLPSSATFCQDKESSSVEILPGKFRPTSAVDVIVRIFNLASGLVEDLYNTLFKGYKTANVYGSCNEIFDMPGLDTNFVPQSLCFVEELGAYAVSGYMSGDDGAFSRIYIVDPEAGTAKEYIIDGYTGHAGGIASCGKDIWFSSGGSQTSPGRVYHLSTDSLKDMPSGSLISYDGYFKTEVKGSFLFCDDETLWVGEFYSSDKDGNKVNPSHHRGDNHSLACGYSLPLDVDYSAKAELAPDVAISVPDKAQGMAIADDGRMIFSSSYGRTKASTLFIYAPYTQWKEEKTEIFGKEVPLFVPADDQAPVSLRMPTLMEGLDWHDGRLNVVFESCAKEYSDAVAVINHAWSMDIQKAVS